MTDTTTQKPSTGRESILLYLAHFIRVGGLNDREEDTDLFGNPVYLMTPWRIEVKAATWTFNQYSVRHMGSSLKRRWRQVRNQDGRLLSKIGTDIEARVPDADNYAELSSYNRVWEITVNLDEFEEGIQEHYPFNAYPF